MPNQHEAGFVVDDAETLHAGRRTLTGSVAVCGAGSLVGTSTDRFDPNDEHACPACGESVSLEHR